MNLLVREFHASPPSLINGVRGMLDRVKATIDVFSPEYLIFALDGGYEARSKLLPAYKAHRGEKPPGLQEQIDLAIEAIDALGWPLIRVRPWEADDVIASLALQIRDIAAGTIVVSSDKDLMQLLHGHPGLKIYRPWKGGELINAPGCVEAHGVTPQQLGDYLALVGDSSDGIPGVKGIGPKKAVELFASYPNLDAILEAARCLRIPGAAGKNLREQADAARLSRRLVELQADLPVGSRWQSFPAMGPGGLTMRPGWKNKLTAMGLGGPAQRFASLGIAETARPGSSLLEFEHLLIDSLADVNLVPIDGEQEIIELSENDNLPRTLAELPPGAHWTLAVRVIHATGLEYLAAGKSAENSWRPRTAHHAAFTQGLAGEPLQLDWSRYDETGELKDTVSVATAKRPQASLFE